MRPVEPTGNEQEVPMPYGHGDPVDPARLGGRASGLALAFALRHRHPDPVYEDANGLYLLRFPCVCCGALTIPARPAPPDADWAHNGLPSAWPCPVCGMLSQYPPTWVAERGRRIADAKRLLAEQGFVTLEHGPLRDPWPSELPDPDDTPRPWHQRVRRVRFPEAEGRG
jgi:hypothetical protein